MSKHRINIIKLSINDDKINNMNLPKSLRARLREPEININSALDTIDNNRNIRPIINMSSYINDNDLENMNKNLLLSLPLYYKNIELVKNDNVLSVISNICQSFPKTNMSMLISDTGNFDISAFYDYYDLNMWQSNNNYLDLIFGLINYEEITESHILKLATRGNNSGGTYHCQKRIKRTISQLILFFDTIWKVRQHRRFRILNKSKAKKLLDLGVHDIKFEIDIDIWNDIFANHNFDPFKSSESIKTVDIIPKVVDNYEMFEFLNNNLMFTMSGNIADNLLNNTYHIDIDKQLSNTYKIIIDLINMTLSEYIDKNGLAILLNLKHKTHGFVNLSLIQIKGIQKDYNRNHIFIASRLFFPIADMNINTSTDIKINFHTENNDVIIEHLYHKHRTQINSIPHNRTIVAHRIEQQERKLN